MLRNISVKLNLNGREICQNRFKCWRGGEESLKHNEICIPNYSKLFLEHGRHMFGHFQSKEKQQLNVLNSVFLFTTETWFLLL